LSGERGRGSAAATAATLGDGVRRSLWIRLTRRLIFRIASTTASSEMSEPRSSGVTRPAKVTIRSLRAAADEDIAGGCAHSTSAAPDHARSGVLQATAGRKGQIRTPGFWETEQEHAGGHADGAAVVGAAGGRRAAVPARRKASARHGVAKGQQRQQRGQQR